MVRVIESGSWTWMVGSWWCEICARAKVVRNWLYGRMDGTQGYHGGINLLASL